MNAGDERDHDEELAKTVIRDHERRQLIPAADPPDINPVDELLRVGALSELALLSLSEEREGDFRRDILELHTRAATLLHLVATW